MMQVAAELELRSHPDLKPDEDRSFAMPQAVARDTTVHAPKGTFAVQPALSELATNWRNAKRFFGGVCHLSDAVALGREPDEDDNAVYEIAQRRYDEALEAVMEYTPRDLDELSLKAVLLNEDEGLFEEKFDALTADVVRLAATNI